MTSDHDPTPTSGARASRDADGPDLDPRWVEAMRRHGGTPADDATWRAIVDRAEDPTPLPSTAGRRIAPRLAWVAAAAVVALVVGAAAVIAIGDGDDAEQVQAGPVGPDAWDAPAEEWERLPDPPLSPRDGVMTAWTGEELLVFGGTTWTCPPNADCMGPEADEILTDGAALDPETREWRSIAPMPPGGLGGSVAVVGDAVFVLRSLPFEDTGRYRNEQTLVSYSTTSDEWTDVAVPPEATSPGYRLAAAGDRLVLMSNDVGAQPTFVLESGTGAWSQLPEPPLQMEDRSAVWSAPFFYVFGTEVVPLNTSWVGPHLVTGARVDLETGEWERLPDSEILGTPYVASDGLLVSPQPGGADGGEVNGWGRTYPYGGIFDTATQTWRDLPQVPGGDDAGMAAGVLGSTSAWFDGSGGELFDTTTEEWTTMPALDEAPGAVSRKSWAGEVHTAGLDAVVVGGVDWSDDEAELLGDAWIWRSGRSGSAPEEEPSADEPDSATTAPDAPGDDTRYFVAATVLDDGDGPELCLGGVATSLPPQCGGPPIEGWDWAAVEGEETAAGTTWGEFEVIGTYDGTTFTLTEEPRPVDPSDDPELLDEPLDIDPDFTAPCPEPEGGWPVADPAVWGIDELNTFLGEARLVEGFAGIWMDAAPGDQQAGGGAGGIYVVAVAGGSDVEARADAALRDLWGGAICVTDAERTYRELEQARDEASALVEESGETLLVSAIDEAGNRVHVQVTAPAPELQAQLDERLGEGTVVLSSALRRLA